jgi:hypothetical protein
MRMLVVKLLVIGALPILLAACGTIPTGGIDGVCPSWRTISWSSRDTVETRDQVVSNNAARVSVCGAPTPAPNPRRAP